MVAVTNIFELTSVAGSGSSRDVGPAGAAMFGTALLFSMSTLLEPMFTSVRLEKHSREKCLLETLAPGGRSVW